MKPFIVDTNLLVLLVVGSVSEAHIARHRRTKIYDPDAFRLLVSVVGQAPSLIVTPHVLSETSNLIRQCGEPLASSLGRWFTDFVTRTSEEHREACALVQRPEHIRLGLTDVGILEVQVAGASLLTDDNGLYLASLAAGRAAVNFSHLREVAM